MKYTKVKKKLILSDNSLTPYFDSNSNPVIRIDTEIRPNSIPFQHRSMSAASSDPRYKNLTKEKKREIDDIVDIKGEIGKENILKEGSDKIEEVAKAVETMFESIGITYTEKCNKLYNDLIDKAFKKVLK